jgi:hypothetical protein
VHRRGALLADPFTRLTIGPPPAADARMLHVDSVMPSAARLGGASAHPSEPEWLSRASSSRDAAA